MTRRILRNSIKCPDGMELVSRHQHDYVSYCDAKNRYFVVDGGSEYRKRSGVGYTETSVLDDGKFETQRKVCEWGVNLDENGRLLPDTKWTKIKDLNTEHIYNILKNVKSISDFYKRLLEDEIIHREEIIMNGDSKF